MKLRVIALVVLLAGFVEAGFVLTEENDTFSGSDDQYTQGLELKYLTKPVDGKRYGYGVRNLMYTPKDITIAEEQPYDRPWAGISGLFVERWSRHEDYLYRIEVFAGVTGEWSGSDELQTWFHKQIDNKKPMGWDNQIPEEFVINFAFDSYMPVWREHVREWSADATMIGALNLGTAFVNAEAGALFRAGYNVPDDYKTGLVKPTDTKSRFSSYLFCEITGRAVMHNITLGGSWFQDGPEVDIVPLVSEARGGLAVGVLNVRGYDIAASYSLVVRSPEFEGQDEAVDFGSISISVGIAL